MSTADQPAGEIVGYVEAATSSAVLGWAWAPRRPEARIAVALRLGGATIASGLADELRDDLARNGVGDGCHAFSLPVPEGLRDRLGDLRVVAQPEDGAPVTLGSPPAAEAVTERLDRLQRGLDMVVASQRVLHRNLQAALLQSDGPADAEAPRLHEAVAAQIAALEIFVMRLDERLAALAPAGPPPAARSGRPSPRMMIAASLLVVLGAAAVGLYHSVLG